MMKIHNYICCPVGTGGTISGIINSSHNQKSIRFSGNKRIMNDLETNIKKWTNETKLEIN